MLTHYIDQLNDQQRQSALHTEGPLMILAGAGTGKTKTLTARIAYIIEKGLAAPWQVLAVTFTNKASQEMRNRINEILGHQTTAWIGTFHSIASKILRTHAELLGFDSNFTIVDTEEQESLLKSIAKEMMPDFLKNNKNITPKYICKTIQRWKDDCHGPAEMAAKYKYHETYGNIAALYAVYQERLKKSNAMDFGDLLTKNLELFHNPEILQHYQNKFRYIMIDECQDTNATQHLWIKCLGREHRNICCVGDDDQSIYSWRGARIDNMLNFAKEFPETVTVKLEQNYRSTDNILNVAASIIAHNKQRLPKTIWSNKQNTDKIKIIKFSDRESEASHIISQSLRIQKISPEADCAILVRSGAQTRVFEEACLKFGAPYQIIGNIKFYNRTEIKDMIAYLKAASNPNDDVAVQRIINKPRRGIGETTVSAIIHHAILNQITMCQSILEPGMDEKIRAKATPSMLRIKKWHELAPTMRPAKLLQTIFEESGYKAMLIENKDQESENALDNINELINSLQKYDTLTEFLEQAALNNPSNEQNAEAAIKIMTIHAAKGLEFHSVFLPNWEEGTFPNKLALMDQTRAALEEERRLAYVAITRAKSRLCISYSVFKNSNGHWMEGDKSNFIDEIDPQTIEFIDLTATISYRPYDHTRKGSGSPSLRAAQQPIPPRTPESADPAGASSNKRLVGKKIDHPDLGRLIVLSVKNDVAEVLSMKSCKIMQLQISELNNSLLGNK